MFELQFTERADDGYAVVWSDVVAGEVLDELLDILEADPAGRPSRLWDIGNGDTASITTGRVPGSDSDVAVIWRRGAAGVIEVHAITRC